MTTHRTLIIFFNDGTKVRLRWPKQGGQDPVTLMKNVQKAIDADKLAIEVDGDLLIIPMRNVKYIQVSPAPEALPAGVIRRGQVL